MLTALLFAAALATPAVSIGADPVDTLAHAPIDHVDASPAPAPILPAHFGAAIGSGAGILAATPVGLGAATTAGGLSAMLAFAFGIGGAIEPALGILAAGAIAMPLLFTLPVLVMSIVGAGIGEAATGGDVVTGLAGGAVGGVAAAGTTMAITVGAWALSFALSGSNDNAGLIGIGGTVAGVGAGVVVGAVATGGMTSMMSGE